MCKTYISHIKDLRLRLEDCESRTVARIRQPIDKDPLKDCGQKTKDQKVLGHSRSPLKYICQTLYAVNL